jgi:hypothetical protein
MTVQLRVKMMEHWLASSMVDYWVERLDMSLVEMKELKLVDLRADWTAMSWVNLSVDSKDVLMVEQMAHCLVERTVGYLACYLADLRDVKWVMISVERMVDSMV